MPKRISVVALLVLGAMLLSMMPVMAQGSYNRIVFACEAKGPGLVVWGAGVLPGPVPYLFGTPEYHALLETSTFSLAGTAKVEWSDFDFGAETYFCYLFEEGTAKIAGTMRAQWTAPIDGESHELTIAFESTEETLGFFAGVWSSHPFKWGHTYLLGIGDPVPLPDVETIEDMDPQFATLAFHGIYRHGDVTEKISGVAHLFTEDFPESSMKVRDFILNLWIDKPGEPGTYVALGWFNYVSGSPEDLFGPGPEILLPARVLKVKTKLI